jgi:quercetin dioxygenase-like cupin family protein
MNQALFVAVLALMGALTPVQDAPVLVSPDDVKWGEGPPSLPSGVKASLIFGDPSKAGQFVLRAKMPAGYRVPPHFHPDTETVTVLSGTLHASMGDTFDASKAKAMAAGSFLALPGKTPHFVYTTEETVIQVSAVGPWSLTYVNPADDPRNAKK